MANSNAKPPKRRKSHGRNPKGGNKKRTTYDYSAARESLGLSEHAPSQAIVSRTSAVNPDDSNVATAD
jgi:hypothetical protein